MRVLCYAEKFPPCHLCMGPNSHTQYSIHTCMYVCKHAWDAKLANLSLFWISTMCKQQSELGTVSSQASLLYGSAASLTAVAMKHCMNRTFFYRTAVRMTETMRVKPKLWVNLKQPTTGTDVAVIWHSLKKVFSMCEPGLILQLTKRVC